MKKSFLAIISLFLALYSKFCFADIAYPDPVRVYNGNKLDGIQPNEVLAMMIVEGVIFIIIMIAIIILMKSKRKKTE